MNIIEQVESGYKNNPAYGIKFSIEPEAYNAPDDVEVRFGKNVTELSCGTFYNYQEIIIDGEPFGFLMESQRGRLFDPMCTSFCYCIADCEDDNYDEMFEKYKDNPHFFDAGESIQLNFATLEQFLQFHSEMVAQDYRL